MSAAGDRPRRSAEQASRQGPGAGAPIGGAKPMAGARRPRSRTIGSFSPAISVAAPATGQLGSMPAPATQGAAGRNSGSPDAMRANQGRHAYDGSSGTADRAGSLPRAQAWQCGQAQRRPASDSGSLEKPALSRMPMHASARVRRRAPTPSCSRACGWIRRFDAGGQSAGPARQTSASQGLNMP